MSSAIIALGLAFGVGAGLWFVNSDSVSVAIEREIEQSLDRDVVLEGGLQFHIDRARPSVILRDVNVPNFSFAAAPFAAYAERVTLTFDSWRTVFRNPVLQKIRVSDAKVSIETTSRGDEANWRIRPLSIEAGRGLFPTVDVSSLVIDVRDGPSGAEWTFSVPHARIEPRDHGILVSLNAPHSLPTRMRIQAILEPQGSQLSFRSVFLRLGDVEASGVGRYCTGSEGRRPRVEARLTSNRVDLVSLAEVLGAPGADVLSEQVSIPGLDGLDGVVRILVRQIERGEERWQNREVILTVQAGVARVAVAAPAGDQELLGLFGEAAAYYDDRLPTKPIVGP
ncbi:MAG: hypothetical protein GC199_07790 [Alphaproteobacteria bacterium]|nr:hypothetical protein [Alphaproteobacteria bacterium]